MRELDIDISHNKPKRLPVEMQLHADWAITMGCGDVCPYVPTTVDDWDIPDPARRPISEFGENRDAETIRGCADRVLDQYDDVPILSHILTLAHKQTRECLREQRCALL